MASRIGKSPVTVPTGVEVNINGAEVAIKGSKGVLKTHMNRLVTLKKDGNVLHVTVLEESVEANMQMGALRAIVNNMVTGVTKGFERKLTLVGVGYRAAVQGKVLNLSLGFSHPVAFPIPDGITIDAPSQTDIVVKGADKHLVGQVAANIRAYRPPEPYKGKGIRYADEQVKIKETKKK